MRLWISFKYSGIQLVFSNAILVREVEVSSAAFLPSEIQLSHLASGEPPCYCWAGMGVPTCHVVSANTAVGRTSYCWLTISLLMLH